MSKLEESTTEIERDYARYIASVSIRNSKVGCILATGLMPLGVVLDYFVYPDYLGFFFELRVLCSALTALVLLGLCQPRFAERHYEVLSMGWYLLPAFFISCMIATSDGVASPYYAGLNLVILAVSSVIQATFMESVVAASLVFAMYGAACFINPHPLDTGMLANNLYFMILTALIVATGNYFFNRLRFREFALRFELDKSRQMLEQNNKKLREMDEMKNRFFANISHELRTPLTLVLSPLATLVQQPALALTSEAQQILKTMETNGLRLLKLINDLLDLAKLESGRMQLRIEPIEVEPFLRGLSDSVRHLVENNRLRLSITVEPNLGVLRADKDKLEKVVLNLLFNAIKFTPAGGHIEIRAERQNSDLVVRVTDTGVGIAAQDLPFVFDRFWQADNSSHRKYQGTGIGLALVKELVELHGGTVGVQSQLNKGTIVTVLLPLVRADISSADVGETTSGVSRAPANGDAFSPEDKLDPGLAKLYRRAELFPPLPRVQESLHPVEIWQHGGRPSVLIADDEPDMLRFLSSQLKPRFQVLEAVDGQQAIDKAKQFLPDIILIDLMMPEKDGLQVCRELRELVATQRIPIVLLTARADEETKLTALAGGATDFLTKPFSTTELQVRLKNLVDSHHFQRTLARQNQILEATLEQLKETESQLVQSEKLAALGLLSAGIVHEINNPLNFAKTGLYILRERASILGDEQRRQFHEILHDIEDGVNRVRNIVTDLKVFTRPTEAFDQVSVKKLVASAARWVSHELKDGVRFEEKIPEDQTVCANENQIVQVLINLLQNARDALKKKSPSDEPPTIWVEGAIVGDKSLLTIRDNGEGIAPSNVSKIFDPFFTTKDVGEGMGLGLSICYRIMRNHGGRIAVKSELGKGSEFTLEFPVKL